MKKIPCGFCNKTGYVETRAANPDAEGYRRSVCDFCTGLGHVEGEDVDASEFAAHIILGELKNKGKPQEVTCDSCGGMKEVWHTEYCKRTGVKTFERLELCSKCAGTGVLKKGQHEQAH